MKVGLLMLCLAITSLMIGCSNPQERDMQQVIDDYLAEVKPLLQQAALAYWEAARTGDEKSFTRNAELELQIRTIRSDQEKFQRLQLLRKVKSVRDPLPLRQIEILYNDYLPNQIDTTLLRQIVEKSSVVEQKFSTFRGEMNGVKMTNNEIGQILKKETNSTTRERAWLAGKQVGAFVADDVIELAHLRNAGAQKLGFTNFHAMSLTASEQNIDELDALFADLEELTAQPFATLKSELDARLAEAHGIAVAELMPWHYHDLFFQEPPLVHSIDLDSYYAGHNIVELAKQFYAGIDMDVESILARSDLYERENKNPHAFCTDIDREGDVRILCNIENNERWMETLLHELGHAVYDKYHDPALPFLLREPASAFATEAIAMFFGRLSCNADWMQRMLDLSDSERDEIAQVAGKHMQLKQLIFARWAMVMYHFEKQLYRDPAQDLNALWWQLVERFQMVRKPAGRDEPDWAAKIHVALYPAYYHNYVLGELFASQLHHHIIHSVLKLDSDDGVNYIGQVEVGNYLKESVFRPGKSAPWATMVANATGEPLTAAHFAQQFVQVTN